MNKIQKLTLFDMNREIEVSSSAAFVLKCINFYP